MPSRFQFKTEEEYKDWYRKYRQKNRDKFADYNRVYNKLWRQKNGYHNERNSKKRYPEKQKARNMVLTALANGKLVKKPCKICNELKVEGHHEDYSKPLKVVWLCKKHHVEADIKLRNRIKKLSPPLLA
jgi:hypothetical protein